MPAGRRADIAEPGLALDLLAGDSGSARWLEGVITFAGRQDNLALREVAFVAGLNVLMVAAAIVSIVLTVPKGRRTHARGAAGQPKKTTSWCSSRAGTSRQAGLHSHAAAAVSIARAPTSKVGSSTGAKRGEWLLGMVRTLPSATALAYVAGSVPPMNQNT